MKKCPADTESFIVCLCDQPHLSCVPNYVITLLCHYSHEHSGSYWKFIGPIGQGTRLLCCLEGEKVVGSDDTSVFVGSGS